MKQKQKIVLIFGVVALGIAAVVGWLAWSKGKAAQDDAGSAGAAAQETAKPSAADQARKARGEAKPKPDFVERADTADREDLSPEDKRLMLTIESALEAEDLSKLLAIHRQVLNSKNDELRSDMVDALDWFGVEAMSELLDYVTDPDEDIAQEALSAWTSALSDVESESEKLSLVTGAMKIIRDVDALESMVMELDEVDDVKAVQTLLDVIACDNPKAVKVAKSHYEFLTDEKFKSFEAAEAWLQANYEVDDDTEDGAVVKYSKLIARKQKSSSSRSGSSHVAAVAEQQPADDGGDAGVGDAVVGDAEGGGELADDVEDPEGFDNDDAELDSEPEDGESEDGESGDGDYEEGAAVEI